MRIVQISRWDKTGGAATAAYRLHDSLRKSGCDSILYVLDKVTNDLQVHLFKQPRDVESMVNLYWRRARVFLNLARYYQTIPGGYDRFSQPIAKYGKAVVRQLPPSDIVNLHWITGFVDLADFFSLVKKPLVWTLHDMNAFTGGCHYDWDCGKFSNGCGGCPQLGSDRDLDLSRRMWERKKSIYGSIDSKRLTIVTPTRWLMTLAKQSPLLSRFPMKVVPYGIDTDLFSPKPVAVYKNDLGIKSEETVLLFVAQSIKNRRKGFHLLSEAVKELKTTAQKLVLISVGVHHQEVSTPLRHIALGEVKNDELLSMIYNVADIFVMPSLQDNLPNTVIESIACGTPVVCFKIGGVSEMIKSGVNGMALDEANVKSLVNGISELVSNRELRAALSQGARQVAEREYDSKKQSERYLQIYQEMMTWQREGELDNSGSADLSCAPSSYSQ
ncbi:MAG: glycosyltransferase family 4 protein [Gammaproteobacteria bacterium]|nr:glycosyltransferase family 4 protein [Gammaproteobacteria bacterium]